MIRQLPRARTIGTAILAIASAAAALSASGCTRSTMLVERSAVLDVRSARDGAGADVPAPYPDATAGLVVVPGLLPPDDASTYGRLDAALGIGARSVPPDVLIIERDYRQYLRTFNGRPREHFIDETRFLQRWYVTD